MEDCDFCAWFARAERFAFAAPWTSRPTVRSEDRPTRWPSVTAALRALVEHEQHGRDLTSPLAGVLVRLEGRDGGGRPDVRRESATTRRADSVMDVRLALERAFAGQHVLSAGERIRVLFERTPGVLERVTPYEELAERYGLSIGELQSIVRRARHVIAADLCERGLIPVDAQRSRGRTGSSTEYRGLDAT